MAFSLDFGSRHIESRSDGPVRLWAYDIICVYLARVAVSGIKHTIHPCDKLTLGYTFPQVGFLLLRCTYSRETKKNNTEYNMSNSQLIYFPPPPRAMYRAMIAWAPLYMFVASLS